MILQKLHLNLQKVRTAADHAIFISARFFSFSPFQIHAINVQLLAKLHPHYCITCCTFYHLSFKAKSSASSLVVTVMKCLIVHNEIFNWTNAMIVYVHAKLHMRKLDEAKPLRILKPRFHFWWCCNWSKGSCNIWLVMKTGKTQGIILNYLKQDGFSMQTEHGYVLSRTNLTIRSLGLKSYNNVKTSVWTCHYS